MAFRNPLLWQKFALLLLVATLLVFVSGQPMAGGESAVKPLTTQGDLHDFGLPTDVSDTDFKEKLLRPHFSLEALNTCRTYENMGTVTFLNFLAAPEPPPPDQNRA